MRSCAGQAILLGFLASSSACAGIHEARRDVDTPRRAYTTRETSAEPMYEVVSTAQENGDGVALSIKVRQGRRCNVVEHQVASRQVEIIREPDTSLAPYWIWGGVTVAGGAGATAYLASSGSDDAQKVGIPLALAAAAGGLVLLTIAGVDSIRATDEFEAVGEVDRESIVATDACDLQPGGGLAVLLRNPYRGRYAEGRTDESGTVTLEVAARDLESFGPGFTLDVEGTETGPIKVLGTPHQALVAKAADREASDRRASFDRVAASEAASGTCTPTRLASLQQRLHEARKVPSLVDRHSGLVLMDHKILAVPEGGARVTFRSLLGGTIHVFALAYQPLDLGVFSTRGDESVLTSSFRGRWHEFPDSDTFALLDDELRAGRIKLAASRMLQLSPADDLRVDLRTSGCALVAVYEEF